MRCFGKSSIAMARRNKNSMVQQQMNDLVVALFRSKGDHLKNPFSLFKQHQYFFPRDYTSNMGYVWHSAWRGQVSLGIRQLPDDASPFYPWSNAPPGSEQQMRLFLLLQPGDPHSALDVVLRFTHSDRFPAP